jgi:hypothetical protein
MLVVSEGLLRATITRAVNEIVSTDVRRAFTRVQLCVSVVPVAIIQN